MSLCQSDLQKLISFDALSMVVYVAEKTTGLIFPDFQILFKIW